MMHLLGRHGRCLWVSMRFGTMLVCLAALIGCSAEPVDGGGVPSTVSPQPQPSARPGLRFTSPCKPDVCGAAPEENATCRRNKDDVCAWFPDTPVSYRSCEPKECGVEPTITCAAPFSFAGNTCGSEDERPCEWTTICLPPKSTTPCGDRNGCGPKPDLGVVCKDGGAGDLVCMDVGGTCDFQRTCD